MKRILVSPAIIFQLLFIQFSSFSQDRNLPGPIRPTIAAGVRDIEVWNTFRTGRNYFYNRLDQRAEFEFGITDKLQSSVYLNMSHIGQAAHLDIKWRSN